MTAGYDILEVYLEVYFGGNGMLLYHGSPTPRIRSLCPRLSNHGKPYVYLTDSPVLATIYAWNPVPRPYTYFPYWWGKDGMLYYDEYFPNAMETVYQGHEGHLYCCEAELPRLENMPWISISESPVAVSGCRWIPDLYEELLRLEQEGRLICRRYEQRSPREHEQARQLLLREIDQYHLRDKDGDPYTLFIRDHFPGLL